MNNIPTAEDIINNMTPGMRRDLLRKYGLSNLYFMDLYNKKFSPYRTISAPSISLALNDKLQDPGLLRFIADETILFINNKNKYNKRKKVA